MKEKKKTNQQLIDDYDYLANAASVHDCTGLIPGAPISDAQREAYEEIYPYKPPEVESQKPDKKGIKNVLTKCPSSY